MSNNERICVWKTYEVQYTMYESYIAYEKYTIAYTSYIVLRMKIIPAFLKKYIYAQNYQMVGFSRGSHIFFLWFWNKHFQDDNCFIDDADSSSVFLFTTLMRQINMNTTYCDQLSIYISILKYVSKFV